jgi:dCMP deaminase
MDWYSYFKNISDIVALKSKDPDTKVGAVIVGPEKEIVSTGYNSFPRGINDDVESRKERPEKYFWMAHAELNSIVNAARNGVSTKGCSIYTTSDVPCNDCAKAIINAGIKNVFCVKNGGPRSDKWKEQEARSIEMFNEAGVNVYYLGTD